MKKFIAFTMIALMVSIGLAVISPSDGYTAPKDGDVRVWVEFQPGKKGAARAALNGAGAQYHYTFDELTSFVGTLPASALQGISRNPNVVSIEEDVPRYLIQPVSKKVLDDIGDPNNSGQTIPYGIDAVQARQVWDADDNGVPDVGAPTGEGITVCVIDTGFYADHEDLSSVAATGMTQIVDEDFEWNTDGYGHGTHVAGTISAANNGIGVVGVTPGTVSFYIVKYFDNAGEYVVGSSDIVAAINDCADHGAKVINMSLGGSTRNRKEERAFDNLYAAGVLSIAAAGNDAVSDPHYPASYGSVVSVSAIDEENIIADFSNFGDHVELAAPGVSVLSTVSNIPASWLYVGNEAYQGHAMDFSPYGEVTGELVDGGKCLPTDTPGNWTGKVVLCERGDVSFADKVTTAMNGGGSAAVIYNNVEGLFSGTLGEEGDWIVAISISRADGQAALADLGQEGIVLSAPPITGSSYEAWNGTSMATPHVAGVAALIWSADPSLTNAQIREAMNETAMDLGNPGWDEYFGNGLVQAADALAYLGIGPINNAPEVTIDSPSNGASFNSGATISFTGIADDLEDGTLSSSLIWTSSIDGALGSGASVSASLSDGDHTITASVEDSGGKTGSASIDITVGTVQQPESMSVAAIDMSSSSRGRNNTVTTVVTIEDENGEPVLGATVNLSMTGAVTSSGSSVTGADGTVSFSISSRNSGDYTSTVTNVTHSTLVYDASANLETSETLPVP